MAKRKIKKARNRDTRHEEILNSLTRLLRRAIVDEKRIYEITIQPAWNIVPTPVWNAFPESFESDGGFNITIEISGTKRQQWPRATS